MEINLDDIPLGIAETYFDLQKLKSGKLLREIKEIVSTKSQNFNYIVVSMPIYNILEHSSSFLHSQNINTTQECVYFAGKFSYFDCYVDLSMSDNIILFHCDKQKTRELKLKSILENNHSETEFQISIKGVC